MMKNLVLIGMMNCGKTSVGTLLAQKLGRPLVDTDQWIEQQEHCTVSEIFASRGEVCFRALELQACQELGRRSGLVLACGGGLPMTPGCMEALKQNGIIFWLLRDPGESYDQIDASGRPLAQQGREDFLARFAQREPTYRRWADSIITDCSSPFEAAEKILEELKSITHV